MRTIKILLSLFFCIIFGSGWALAEAKLSRKGHLSPPEVKYTYVDIGSELENQLGADPEWGGAVAQYSSPCAINNLGQIVGYVYQDWNGTVRAFSWSNGNGDLLPALPGNGPENESVALSINDQGRIVGYAYVGSSLWDAVTHGVLWDPFSPPDFTLTDLGTQIIPSGINAKGRIFGGSLVYFKNKTYQLEALPVGAAETMFISTWAMNKNELIVGASTADIGGTYVDEAACLWKNGRPVYLGALGGIRGTAYAINDQGQVVGWAETAGGNAQAFLWEKGVMHNLQASNAGSSFAEGINNAGQVVGYCSGNSPYCEGFFWTENDGMQNLQELVVNLPPGVVALNPTAINDQGQIIGDALDIYKGNRAFLLKPLP